ncbi:5-formyltetrahydrofolate cyclo-ligase [Oscillospiraceae bacterium PP1C4]
MQGIDIRPLKQRLRKEIKEWRRALPPELKADSDQKILERLLSLQEYKSCDTLLTYVSLPVEVDTTALIERALTQGKRVAVPRCVEDTREMEFYYITGMHDLAPQTFGVLEPIKEKCTLLREYEGSICIVPALAYDCAGYRLGYGAGYYDRFLSMYAQPKIGITYVHNLRKKLWHGRFDVPVDLIVTETKLRVCTPLKKRR